MGSVSDFFFPQQFLFLQMFTWAVQKYLVGPLSRKSENRWWYLLLWPADLCSNFGDSCRTKKGMDEYEWGEDEWSEIMNQNEWRADEMIDRPKNIY